MEKTIDVRMLFGALLQKLALILACTILGGALLFAFTAFYVKDSYSTSVSILVHNAKTLESTSSTISDINAAVKLTDQFTEILQNQAILTHVAATVGLDAFGEPRVTAEDLSRMLTFSSNGNSILKIKATGHDPELCVDICEAMATRGAELLKQKVEASSVQRLEATRDEIEAPKLISKGVIRKTLLGCIIGFILSAGITAVVFYFDDTVKTSEYFTTYFGVPVLGEVPSLKDGQKITAREGKSYVR